jgi:hypothetical protein
MYTHVRKKASAVKRKANVRVNLGDEEELRQLARSYIARPVHPFVILPDDIIADGNRRHLGLELIGALDHVVDCLVVDKPLPEAELIHLQAVTAMHRRDLSGYEQWQICAKLLSLNPQWTALQLGEYLHKDKSLITRILSPSRCIADVQAALKQEKLTLSHAYAISQAEREQQPELLEMALAGCPREEITKRVHKGVHTFNGKSVKMSRVKIALSGGASVVLTGKALGMSEVIELLEDCLKKAKKAAEKYDVKIFQRMMAAEAKAGGD